MITDYDDFCLRGYALNDDMDQALARTTASTGGRCQCVVTAKCSPWERAVIATAGIWKRKCSIFCRNIEKGSHSAGANVTSGADDAKGAGRALSSLHSLLRGGSFHWASTSRRRARVISGDILLNSRRQRLDVVDDQTQLVIARQEIGGEIKLEQAIDQFIRRPVAWAGFRRTASSWNAFSPSLLYRRREIRRCTASTPRAVSSEQPRANPAQVICSYSLPSSQGFAIVVFHNLDHVSRQVGLDLRQAWARRGHNDWRYARQQVVLDAATILETD